MGQLLLEGKDGGEERKRLRWAVVLPLSSLFLLLVEQAIRLDTFDTGPTPRRAIELQMAPSEKAVRAKD